MKRKTLLSYVIILFLAASSIAVAQNDEYYRPDSLKLDQPEKTEFPPVEKREMAEKKKEVDFKQQPFMDRVRLGGSLGLRIGTFTNINLSPMAGYEITKKLVGGVGATYMFFKEKGFDSYSFYGGKGFLMYNIFGPINIQAEFEALNVIANYQKRVWIGSPMIGASYSVPIGGRFTKAVHLTALYNLNYYNQVDNSAGPAAAITRLSPYASPFVLRITLL